jgi:hypothetical protein
MSRVLHCKTKQGDVVYEEIASQYDTYALLQECMLYDNEELSEVQLLQPAARQGQLGWARLVRDSFATRIQTPFISLPSPSEPSSCNRCSSLSRPETAFPKPL